MTPGGQYDGEDERPVDGGDPPSEGYKGCGQDDRDRKEYNTNDETQPEAAQDLRDLQEEITPLDFLFGRTPRDIVRKQVGEDRLRKVDGEAAKEEEKEGESSRC